MPISAPVALARAPNPPPLAGLSGWAGKIHAGDCLKVMAKMPSDSTGGGKVSIGGSVGAGYEIYQ